jgi:hypothetical protein
MRSRRRVTVVREKACLVDAWAGKNRVNEVLKILSVLEHRWCRRS